MWRPDWKISSQYKELIGDTGQTRELVGNDMALPGSKYSTSIFNPHLAMMILSAYAPSGGRVFDAFGGGGTRGFIASAMGHPYFGIELREEEVLRIKDQQVTLQNSFEIVTGDSTKYPLHEQGLEDAFDFSYSCPPYYDLEVYSNDDGDLSNVGTYHEFLELLRLSLETTYRALKNDTMCIWVVGNFRDKRGALRHFNGDTVRMAEQAGFVLWDELIWEGASPSAVQRAGQFEANRKSVRMHEYILVFRKP